MEDIELIDMEGFEAILEFDTFQGEPLVHLDDYCLDAAKLREWAAAFIAAAEHLESEVV